MLFDFLCLIYHFFIFFIIIIMKKKLFLWSYFIILTYFVFFFPNSPEMLPESFWFSEKAYLLWLLSLSYLLYYYSRLCYYYFIYHYYSLYFLNIHKNYPRLSWIVECIFWSLLTILGTILYVSIFTLLI